MTKRRKCKACGQTFLPASHNAQAQAFCSEAACQRRRRTISQKLRRSLSPPKQTPVQAASVGEGGASRLHTASVISEGDIRAEHPVIIGLIAMLIGSDDLARVEATYRQLWIHGKRIVSGESAATNAKSPIINLFQDLKTNRASVG
jgi:uncharacterized OB-fold protein